MMANDMKHQLILTTLLLAGSLHAETTPAKALLVLSKGDHTLSIVDPVTLNGRGLHALRPRPTRSDCV